MDSVSSMARDSRTGLPPAACPPSRRTPGWCAGRSRRPAPSTCTPVSARRGGQRLQRLVDQAAVALARQPLQIGHRQRPVRCEQQALDQRLQLLERDRRRSRPRLRLAIGCHRRRRPPPRRGVGMSMPSPPLGARPRGPPRSPSRRLGLGVHPSSRRRRPRRSASSAAEPSFIQPGTRRLGSCPPPACRYRVRSAERSSNSFPGPGVTFSTGGRAPMPPVLTPCHGHPRCGRGLQRQLLGGRLVQRQLLGGRSPGQVVDPHLLGRGPRPRLVLLPVPAPFSVGRFGSSSRTMYSPMWTGPGGRRPATPPRAGRCRTVRTGCPAAPGSPAAWPAPGWPAG